jgi:hypothetical protein
MNTKKLSYNTGSAMLISVILFLFVSLALVLGIMTPALREYKNADSLVKARQSYVLAEAGIEDAVYRIKSGKIIGTAETITLSGNTVTTSITTPFGNSDKQISASSNVSDRKRKVETVLTTSSGTSFVYGVQVGAGGFNAIGNGKIFGTVYSNGPITSGGNAFVTGSAYSATLPSDINRSNENPSTPTSSIVFGNAASTQDVGQSFSIAKTYPISSVSLYMRKVGTPGNITVRITRQTGGSPNTTTVGTATITSASVNTTYGWVTGTFSTPIDLAKDETYFIVLDTTTGSGTTYYELAANTDGYTSGVAKIGQYSGSWGNVSPSTLDGYFRVTLGGVNGRISDYEIGLEATGGDARANTITNTTIRGSAYCQTGSGNNKACTTGQTDPVPQDFQITDSMVDGWKQEALAGGTITGNVSYSSNTPMTLGPKYINGDLTISGNQNVTITGTLWVSGTITISTNGYTELSSSYGANSGMIIADGRVTISSNSKFRGSGTTGSYIMVLTTSACPYASNCSGANAFDISTNDMIPIANAQNGVINFSGNAKAKEITGYRVQISGNGEVTYESGLASVNFAAGPTGSWQIKSWKEVSY